MMRYEWLENYCLALSVPSSCYFNPFYHTIAVFRVIILETEFLCYLGGGGCLSIRRARGGNSHCSETPDVNSIVCIYKLAYDVLVVRVSELIKYETV